MAAQAVRQERQKENQADAKHNGRETQRCVLELTGVARTAQPQEGERGVMESRPVIFVGIVSVATLLPQLADFDGIDRLVVVERARVEVGNPDCERAGKCRQQHECAPALHFAGSAYTSISCQQLSALRLPPFV